MQKSTSQTEAVWRDRVRVWREQGVTAEDYAQGKPFAASTLRYWSSRLKLSESPRLLQVVRRAQAASAVDASGLSVEVAGARVRVERGFDAALLVDVVRALKGAER